MIFYSSTVKNQIYKKTHDIWVHDIMSNVFDVTPGLGRKYKKNRRRDKRNENNNKKKKKKKKNKEEEEEEEEEVEEDETKQRNFFRLFNRLCLGIEFYMQCVAM